MVEPTFTFTFLDEPVGLFTVVIFGPFLPHFWWFGSKQTIMIFKNEVKNNMKSGYCKWSEIQTFQKWSNNAFYLPSAVLSLFKLHLKGLCEIIFITKTKGVVGQESWTRHRVWLEAKKFLLTYVLTNAGQLLIALNNLQKLCMKSPIDTIDAWQLRINFWLTSTAWVIPYNGEESKVKFEWPVEILILTVIANQQEYWWVYQWKHTYLNAQTVSKIFASAQLVPKTLTYIH